MFTFDTAVVSKAGSTRKTFPVVRMYNLCSATRDAAVAVAHQEEVAREHSAGMIVEERGPRLCRLASARA